jgi:hypothetical protein
MVNVNDVKSLYDLVNKFFLSNFSESDNVQNFFGINKNVLYEILNKVEQRKEYFRIFHNINISEFKQIALTVFWTLKLKPIFLKYNDELVENDYEIKDPVRDYVSINEAFGIYMIIHGLRALKENSDNNSSNKRISDFFTNDYIYELRYTFYYRDISKESMILLVETIAKAVGYEPYSCG